MTVVNITHPAHGVAVIEMNRPDVRNAVNLELAQAISDAMDNADNGPDVSVIVFTGAGKSFCTGLDLAAVLTGELPLVQGKGFGGRVKEPPRKPLIAAIEGHALAGGLELALACDLIIASPTRHCRRSHRNTSSHTVRHRTAPTNGASRARSSPRSSHRTTPSKEPRPSSRNDYPSGPPHDPPRRRPERLDHRAIIPGRNTSARATLPANPITSIRDYAAPQSSRSARSCMSRQRDSECVVCSGEPCQLADESCAVLRKVTQGIEDADQGNRRKLLVVGGLIFLIATAILNDRADNEAAALRSDVERTVASLGDTSPAGFWMFDESDPPSTAPDGRSMFVTDGGIEPAGMAFDRGQTFVLYRIETWGKERCVRVVFQTSGVEVGEECVLVDRTE